MKYLKAEALKYGIEIPLYVTASIRKTVIMLYIKFGYVKGLVSFFFYFKIEIIKFNQNKLNTVEYLGIALNRIDRLGTIPFWMIPRSLPWRSE